MRFRVEVIFLDADGAEDRCEVIEVERHHLALDTFGLSLAETKAIVGGLQRNS